MNVDLTPEQKKRLALITVGTLLIIGLVYLLLPSNDNSPRVVQPASVYDNNTSTFTTKETYRLFAESTAIIPPIDNGTFVETIKYNFDYTVVATVYKSVYRIEVYRGTELENTRLGYVTDLDQPIVTAYEWPLIFITTSEVEIESGAKSVVFNSYTFIINPNAVTIIWTGDLYVMEVTYYPESTVFTTYIVWMTFTTSEKIENKNASGNNE